MPALHLVRGGEVIEQVRRVSHAFEAFLQQALGEFAVASAQRLQRVVGPFIGGRRVQRSGRLLGNLEAEHLDFGPAAADPHPRRSGRQNALVAEIVGRLDPQVIRAAIGQAEVAKRFEHFGRFHEPGDPPGELAAGFVAAIQQRRNEAGHLGMLLSERSRSASDRFIVLAPRRPLDGGQ